jgi:hypothetical protein
MKATPERVAKALERITEAIHGLRVEAPIGALNGRDTRKIADALVAELGLETFISGDWPRDYQRKRANMDEPTHAIPESALERCDCSPLNRGGQHHESCVSWKTERTTQIVAGILDEAIPESVRVDINGLAVKIVTTLNIVEPLDEYRGQ